MGTVVVHVVPRARGSAIVGAHGDAVKIRVAAPPVDNAANDELIRFVASRLGLARASVAIAGGSAGRRKVLKITGLDRAEIRRRLLAGPRAEPTRHHDGARALNSRKR